MEREIRPDSQNVLCTLSEGSSVVSRTGEDHFTSVCTEVLSVRRIVVEVLVDAVVNVEMTQLPFPRLQSLNVRENPAECG